MEPRGMGARRFMRSFNRDQSVKDRTIAGGTVKRVLKFAAPYKKFLIIFLIVIIFDAIIGAANPLIYKEIIDNGIIAKNTGLIIQLAALVAVLALVDSGLSFIQRYFSARIGEGLIFDMRTKVFSHIQLMPVAFFTRTQTGSLVSRLNNDVLGAQEAFTDLLSTVIGNVFSVALIIIAMFFLSWQLTLVSLLLLPVFFFPHVGLANVYQKLLLRHIH
jgi:ATP-binding cassette subfamily B protein